jgi:hypothetical protein
MAHLSGQLDAGRREFFGRRGLRGIEGEQIGLIGDLLDRRDYCFDGRGAFGKRSNTVDRAFGLGLNLFHRSLRLADRDAARGCLRDRTGDGGRQLGRELDRSQNLTIEATHGCGGLDSARAWSFAPEAICRADAESSSIAAPLSRTWSAC